MIRQKDCNEYLLERLVSNPKIDWSTWRGMVFSDPFGMQVPWTTLEALAQTKAIDVFLNFPVGMAIQRLLLRSGKFSQRQRLKLDAYLGSPDWYDVLYQVEPNFFGEAHVKVEESGAALVKTGTQSAFRTPSAMPQKQHSSGTPGVVTCIISCWRLRTPPV